MREAPTTVAEAYLHTVTRVPHKEAVVSADGRRYSYDELRVEVERLTIALHTLGCRAGDRVAVWLANSPEWVFAEFACAVLGLVIVPVNARFRAAEAADVMARGHAKVLLTQPNFLSNNYLERLHEIAGGELGTGDETAIAALPELRSIVLTAGAAVAGTVTMAAVLEKAAQSEIELDFVALAAARKPQDPILIFWTSGSTGRPKGAVIPNDCIGNVWNWTTTAAGITEHDRILTSFPVFYIAGNFWCVLAAMVQGATLIMSEEFDGPSIVRMCRQEQVSVLSGIPTMLKEIVHDPAFDPAAFSHRAGRIFWGRDHTLPGHRHPRRTHRLRAFDPGLRHDRDPGPCHQHDHTRPARDPAHHLRPSAARL